MRLSSSTLTTGRPSVTLGRVSLIWDTLRNCFSGSPSSESKSIELSQRRSIANRAKCFRLLTFGNVDDVLNSVGYRCEPHRGFQGRLLLHRHSPLHRDLTGPSWSKSSHSVNKHRSDYIHGCRLCLAMQLFSLSWHFKCGRVHIDKSVAKIT